MSYEGLLVVFGLVMIGISMTGSVFMHEMVHVDNAHRAGCSAEVRLDILGGKAMTIANCTGYTGDLSNLDLADSFNEAVAYNTQQYFVGVMGLCIFVMIILVSILHELRKINWCHGND